MSQLRPPFYHYPISFTLNISPSSLCLASSEPFYVVVTARILSTPYPNKPITLQMDPTPLEGLSNRSFNNIACITDLSKKILIWPVGWLFARGIDTGDLRSHFAFVTIPPKEQGVYSVCHEVPRNKIEAAGLQVGERYSVSLTDKCLSTCWWTSASLEEPEGVRLVAWRTQADDDAGGKSCDPQLAKEIEGERRQTHGDAPFTEEEQPYMLAMVPEVGEVEFEVV